MRALSTGKRITALGIIGAAMIMLATTPAAAGPPGTGGGEVVPSSTSWTTADRGWVLGFEACGDDVCARLVSTADVGETWSERRAPPLRVPERDAQVRVVLAPRTAASGPASVDAAPDAAAVAYATDGRRVLRTGDGARTWQRVRIRDVEGRPSIGDVVATPRRVYAVVGDGEGDEGRTRLFSAGLGADRWRPVDGVATDGNGVGIDGGWDVTARGRAVAVDLGRIFGDVGYWTSADGRAFTAHDAPCAADQVPDLGAIRGDDVAALCSYNPGTGFMHKDLKASTDGGAFEPIGQAPDLGITQEYVAPAPGRHVITAIGGASILYRSTADGWDESLFLADALPWADLQFTDRRHGVVVWGGPRSGMGEVYRSTDAGRTWQVLDLP